MRDEPNLTIGNSFVRTAERCPDRIFLKEGNAAEDTAGGRAWTFAEARAEVDRICAALLALGLKKGDRLGLWIPNSPEWVLMLLACARLGILLVTMNTRIKAEEACYIIGKSKMQTLVMLDRYWGIDYRAILAEALPNLAPGDNRHDGAGRFPALQRTVVLDGARPGFGFADWVGRHFVADAGLVARRQAIVRPESPALTVFTSGTTGLPKGAVHSHVVMRNAENMVRGMHIAPGDVILGHMPYYHIAALITAVLPAILVGATLVTVAHWKADEAARLIARERVAIFGGIPTHFIDLAEVVQREGLDTSCLKSAWIGGATISPEVATRAKATLGLDALQAAYGTTETTGCTTLTPFDDPIEVTARGRGKPVGAFEVKVADPDTGAARPAGAKGEVWVRGHTVMMGYLEDVAETEKVLTADGWFRTGDLGVFDADGYLELTGRLKDMFIVGGSNVYPAEIEHMLEKMAGVRQAVVVGAPDARLGQVGFAFVERVADAALTADEVVAWAKERLSDYKVPRHVAFVDGFPMTGTRKIQRHVLVKDAIARLEKRA